MPVATPVQESSRAIAASTTVATNQAGASGESTGASSGAGDAELTQGQQEEATASESASLTGADLGALLVSARDLKVASGSSTASTSPTRLNRSTGSVSPGMTLTRRSSIGVSSDGDDKGLRGLLPAPFPAISGPENEDTNNGPALAFKLLASSSKTAPVKPQPQVGETTSIAAQSQSVAAAADSKPSLQHGDTGATNPPPAAAAPTSVTNSAPSGSTVESAASGEAPAEGSSTPGQVSGFQISSKDAPVSCHLNLYTCFVLQTL